MAQKPTGIERLRAELLMRTQTEVAAILECSQQAICQWAADGSEPKHSTRVLMHRRLGIPWDVPWR